MIAVSALLLALALPAAAQPALSYDAPAGWKRGPYSSPVVYTAPGGKAELHVSASSATREMCARACARRASSS